MREALTQKLVDRLQPPAAGQLDVFDTKLGGFGVRVAASGHKAWFIMYRVGGAGKVRRFTIAPCDLLTLDVVRDQARELLLAAHKGNDPAAIRQAQRETARGQEADESFAELAAVYLVHAKTAKRSWRIDEKALNRDVLRVLGAKRAREVRADDVEALVERIMERGAPVQAKRTLAIVRRIFSFGLKKASARLRFGLTANPCAGVESPVPERSRDRVLSNDEVRRLWQALDVETPDIAGLVRLGLFTAQRGGELRTMRREDVDLESAWWTIPAERSKNKLPHRVPLSPPAVALIREQMARHGSQWVFPGTGREGYRGLPDKAVRRLQVSAAIADWRLHDLRRTAATGMASMGVARVVIKRVLNHAEGDVTAIYERHSFDPEKRQALDAWARRLHAIVTGETAAKIVPLRSA